MKYFKDIQGKFTTNDGTEIINLLKSIKLDEVLNEKYYIDYTLADGETPTKLASEIYGDEELWWIPFICNNIIDPFFDWPMPGRCLRDYFDYLVENNQFAGTSSDWNTLVEVNNNKRNIKLLNPEYLGQFLFVVDDIINNL